jgi:hypothetical protein
MLGIVSASQISCWASTDRSYAAKHIMRLVRDGAGFPKQLLI